MKLYLVIYVMNAIGGYAGPLPYDMAECERRAGPMRANVAHYSALGVDVNGNPLSEEARSMRFVCEFRTEKPYLNPALGVVTTP